MRAVRDWRLPTTEGPGVRAALRASLRATQELPLSALLHSYRRSAHRTVWNHLVHLLTGSDDVLDASLALTALTLAYTELISGNAGR